MIQFVYFIVELILCTTSVSMDTTKLTWTAKCYFLFAVCYFLLLISPLGYMDGTVTREVLRSLQEESAENPKLTLLSDLSAKILKGEKYRADYFKTAPFPYGSEFAYDTTGQEEVVVWQLFFNYDSDAARTVDHILQYMRGIPNWAYNGGAVAGDVANGGKWLVSAGTGRGDFGKMHYRAGLNQIPLAEWYRRHPDDLQTLEIAVGAMSGQLGNIDSTGAPSIYFHAYPHILEHDAYSGDYGLGFFGSSLESSSVFVVHPTRGPLCYLCDASALNSTTNMSYTIAPKDAYRQRVYLEPIGTYIQLDAGVIDHLEFRPSECSISVFFADPDATPAGFQSYEYLRLRVDKVARESANRSASNFTLTSPIGVRKSRSAFEIPPSTDAVIEYAAASCNRG